MSGRKNSHRRHGGVRRYVGRSVVSIAKSGVRPTSHVIHRSGKLQKSWLMKAMMLLLASLLAFAVSFSVGAAAGIAYAAPASGSSSSSSSSSSADEQVTDNITDTQNLLGGNISRVTDAIASVKAKTGVTLKLLYLPSFDTTEKPATWAKSVLNSTQPAKNTVMLAVASQDGDLVVVVSSNSDSWLRDSSTVNALSDAALGPIVKNASPDWAQSAIALANKIISIKQNVDAEPIRRFWLIFAVVVGVLVVAAAGYIGYLLYRGRRRKPGKHSGKHSE